MKTRSPGQPRMQLREARLAGNWSQQALADALGTTHVNVSRWERGITKPSPYYRRKLCQLFGKTEAELDLVQMHSEGGEQWTLPLRLLLSHQGEEHTLLFAIDEENRLTLKIG